MPPVAEGQILTGDQFAEPVRVETIKQVSPGAWEVGVSGLNSQKFRKVTLSSEDFKGISASTPTSAYTSKGEYVHVTDVHTQNLGYDLTSVDPATGELRLIEVKGLSAAASEGSVMLTPNEVRVAKDRRDCFWLYVVSDCKVTPFLQTIFDPARFQWEEVLKVAHYALPVRTIASGDQRS